MNLTVLHRHPLKDIPSASGLELIGDSAYVTGDDAPRLFRLDARFQTAGTLPLVAVLPPPDSLRIPKLLKPDFEAMASFLSPSGPELLLFGSGSKSPERDSLARVSLEPRPAVTLYSLRALYDLICQEAGLKEAALNIEAAVVHAGELYLFNRGENLIAVCPLDRLIAHLTHDAPCPVPAIHRVELPRLEEDPAGFSGATLLPGGERILFTASVERTDNWIDDGEVTGSFVGLIDLPLSTGTIRPECVPLRDPDGRPLPIKAESIAVKSSPADGVYHLLIVTDSDGGESELVEATLHRK